MSHEITNRTIRATLVRGGTSKCWVFDAEELDRLPLSYDEVLLGAYGSPDMRQIDGVGGATSTTSKALIIRPAHEPHDVEYTFAQVGIEDAEVEWGSNCGNCASAVGLYAVQQGLVAVQPGSTTVRMLNTNTGATLDCTVATPDGRIPHDGDASIPGVPRPGVGVDLVFHHPGGARTGRLLPSGNPVDQFEGEGTAVRATLVDAGAPAALVAAEDIGLTGAESLAELAEAIDALRHLRRSAALAMGLAGPEDPVSHAIPKTGVVGAARDYRTTDGRSVAGREYDISARMLSMHAPHPLIGLTSVVAIAAAGSVPGTLVNEIVGNDRDRIRIGTAGGVLTASVRLGADHHVESVAVGRSARRLADAAIFLPFSRAGSPRLDAPVAAGVQPPGPPGN
jgi:2-methylaconitate cis-trans-isomerase PrpF